jgi:hypothetical protein
MGRAHSQSPVATGFDTVLGTRRGLGLVLQRERDSADVKIREPALEEFAAAVEKECGWRGAVTLINDAYRRRTGVVGDDELVSTLTQALENQDGLAQHPFIHELSVIVTLDEPLACPGLITPVVMVLGAHFAHSPRIPEEAFPDCVHGRYIIDNCFARPRELEYYQRLAPLCAGLGALISNAKKAVVGEELCVSAAEALVSAPLAAISGPLRSWVEAFAERIRAGRFGGDERQVFWDVLGDRLDWSKELKAALAPLRGLL